MFPPQITCKSHQADFHRIAERRFYENLLDEICKLFEVETFLDNSKLDGLYLLGFHSQSQDLKEIKKENSEENLKESEEEE